MIEFLLEGKLEKNIKVNTESARNNMPYFLLFLILQSYMFNCISHLTSTSSPVFGFFASVGSLARLQQCFCSFVLNLLCFF